MAHIVAFDLANPALAEKRKIEGLTVSHACHRPQCCNPSHLSLATLHANAAANRGRFDISGERHPKAKLKLQVVRAIKQLIAQELDNRQIISQIEEKYGAVVTTMTVTDIRRKRSWKEEPPADTFFA
jgi:Tfp pilus assembly pilus retraction ATPase PilT